jgi:hypothetical protein
MCSRCDRSSCCGQDGFCAPYGSPVRVVYDDENRPVRLNIILKIQGFCSSTEDPFENNDMMQVPEQLNKMGLGIVSWMSEIDKLKEVCRLRDGSCKECVGYSSVFLLPCFIPVFCQAQKTSIMKWNEALRRWQREFNEKTLTKLGMFCKTQSYCTVTRGGKTGRSRHFARWLAVALTPEAIEQLRSEPHVDGDVDPCGACNCCGCPEEADCCVHPYNF